MANSWTNSDGLTIYFGSGERSLALDGDYEDYDRGEQVYEFLLDLTTLTTSTAVIANVRGHLPSLARTVKVEMVCQTAAATGTSFSIGMQNERTGTAIGTAGASLVTAVVAAAMSTVGETTVVTAELTYAGDKLGLAIGTTAAPVVFTAKMAGSTFTTGLVRVKVMFQRILDTA